MVDPTWTRTCPCGKEVGINALGQHHHTDCEFDPLHPACCGDSHIRRLWYFSAAAGTRCEACGATWGTHLGEQVSAMASYLVDDYNIEREARGEIYSSNLRALQQSVPAPA